MGHPRTRLREARLVEGGLLGGGGGGGGPGKIQQAGQGHGRKESGEEASLAGRSRRQPFNEAFPSLGILSWAPRPPLEPFHPTHFPALPPSYHGKEISKDRTSGQGLGRSSLPRREVGWRLIDTRVLGTYSGKARARGEAVTAPRPH